MSFKENWGVWLGLAAAVLIIALLVWLLISGGPHTLVILFPDIGDLKKDDPVLWRDYTVGRVEKIEPLVDNEVGVTISIREDYAARITRGTRFTLKRTALFGLVGKNAIELETPAENGLPYLDGERVQGISPPKPTIIEAGKQWTIESWQQLKDTASNLLDQYQNSPYRKEIDDALRELRALADTGTKQAADKLDQFRKEHQQEFDRALERLEQVRDWMRKKGDDLGARRIQEEIDKLRGK